MAEPVKVDPITSLGSLFDFDADAFLEERLANIAPPEAAPGTAYTPPNTETFSSVGYESLGESDPLQQVENVASQFMSGQLPQDVADQIRRSAAERSVQGGYGGTQLARNLTLRDIGVTSLQTLETGAKLGLAATELGSKREMSDADRLLQSQTYNTELFEKSRQFDTATGQFAASFNEGQRQFDYGVEQSAAGFSQEIKKWEDQFALSLRSSDDAGAQIAMQALAAQSANRSFRISEENKLIGIHSQFKIDGLQEILDSMAPLYDNLNRQYQEILNLYANN